MLDFFWLFLVKANFYLKLSVPSQTFKRGEKKVAQISFASVHLVNTGEYTCQARNGALDGNGNVIEAEKTINLFVRCTFCDALIELVVANTYRKKFSMPAHCLTA